MTDTTCEWFALCDHPAIGTVAHPAFVDGVPICARCAKRMEMTDKVVPYHHPAEQNPASA